MAPDRDEAVESGYVRKHEVEEYKVLLRMEPRRLTRLVDRAYLSDHGLIQHRMHDGVRILFLWSRRRRKGIGGCDSAIWRRMK